MLKSKHKINVYPRVFAQKFDPQWMEINCAKVRRAMVQGVKDYFLDAGRNTAVIGLSGGLDSTVAAQIAVEALGKKKVVGVAMPYQKKGDYKQQKDWQDAKMVAEHLKIEFMTRPITSQTDASAWEAGINFISSDLSENDISRLGNIKARQRMIMLYDVSAESGGLVIGTGNKSEITVGYCTLWGDTACAVNPLGEIYKTQEYVLAEYMKVPRSIIERIPSAGLFEGQTDEGQMGFLYRELDPLSFLLFDQKLPVEKVVEFGFTRRFIDKVLKMHKANAFKFSMPAIIPLPKLEVRLED